jgi:hypothetical protein
VTIALPATVAASSEPLADRALDDGASRDA